MNLQQKSPSWCVPPLITRKCGTAKRTESTTRVKAQIYNAILSYVCAQTILACDHCNMIDYSQAQTEREALGMWRFQHHYELAYLKRQADVTIKNANRQRLFLRYSPASGILSVRRQTGWVRGAKSVNIWYYLVLFLWWHTTAVFRQLAWNPK